MVHAAGGGMGASVAIGPVGQAAVVRGRGLLGCVATRGAMRCAGFRPCARPRRGVFGRPQSRHQGTDSVGAFGGGDSKVATWTSTEAWAWVTGGGFWSWRRLAGQNEDPSRTAILSADWLYIVRLLVHVLLDKVLPHNAPMSEAPLELDKTTAGWTAASQGQPRQTPEGTMRGKSGSKQRSHLKHGQRHVGPWIEDKMMP